MGCGAVANADVDSETALLLPISAVAGEIPKDPFHLTYITHFFLGLSCVLPWTTFITAIDYFSHFYPGTHVNRIFGVAYMVVSLIGLVFVIFFARRSDARVRVSVGLGIYVLSLLVVPLLDVFYIRTQVGLYNGFYVTVGAVVLCGVGDALVQGGVIGCAAELPQRYMQAVVSGIAASGVIASVLRIVTKAIYPRDAHGLRQSAILYFSVGISIIILCNVMYNVAAKLPVVKHYEDLKSREKEKKGPVFASIRRSTLWEILSAIKMYAFGVLLVFIVSLSIFPGSVTEDVHSEIFKDWYPIILITAYYVSNLFGKYLSSVYLLKNPKITLGSCVGTLLFYPLFVGCLHGPQFLRTEVPVVLLTCLLGLTAGYFAAVGMILAPKLVPFEYAEVAGILMVIFLVSGLAIGSAVAWFWVI